MTESNDKAKADAQTERIAAQAEAARKAAEQAASYADQFKVSDKSAISDMNAQDTSEIPHQSTAQMPAALSANEASPTPSTTTPLSTATQTSGQQAAQAAAAGMAGTTAGSATAAHGTHATHAANTSTAASVPTSPVSSASTSLGATNTSTKSAKKGGGLKTFLLGFLGAALACLLAAAAVKSGVLNTGANTDDSSSGVQLGATTSTQITANDEDSTLAEQVAAKVLPSIVAIDVYASSSGWSDLLGGNSSSSGTLVQTSLGSGVVISSDGYIITNYHVVENAQALRVTIGTQEYEATVVGSDPSSDLAVLKVDATNLTAVEIGSSSDLQAGQWVMTLGSPFGLEQSVATGIISATSRTVVMGSSSTDYSTSSTASVYPNMIQTDAAINPGNSGGALVDSNGRLIGINSVIESYSGNYSGVGFAIPVDYAINIANQIIEGKTPSHAQLGVATVTVNASNADTYGLSVDRGAYINEVYVGSSAETAGLQQGDIITKVDDAAIESSTDLMANIRSREIGSKVTITYVRNGQESTVEVELGSDENSSAVQTPQDNSGWEGNGGNNDGGSDMQDLWDYFFNGGSGN